MFRIVELEDWSIERQMQLLAEYPLVAPHGAGLTNAFDAGRGKVLEIRPSMQAEIFASQKSVRYPVWSMRCSDCRPAFQLEPVLLTEHSELASQSLQ